ncbi:MAG: hypothetical protein K2K64_07690 [Muribaculaceae bacterium]|nr:hypothetical protein [Muribaculaceae bacterium]
MTPNSQWSNVIYNYGIGNRSDYDVSLGVDKIINDLQEKLTDVSVGNDLEAHFRTEPLSYIFVNNKNIPSGSGGEDPCLNDALTECELTFFQNDDNTLRFRYFIQITHRCMIHGLSWVKSSPDIESDAGAFRQVKKFIENSFTNLSGKSTDNADKSTFGIWDGHANRLGSMHYLPVEGFTTDITLKASAIQKIEVLITEALDFFTNNNGKITSIFNQYCNNRK